MTFSYVVVAEARLDIRDILVWSQARFGDAVRDGYEELIVTGFADIADDPTRVGAHQRPELGATVMSWHLAQSRDHIPESVRRIVSPRHFIFYRVVGNEIYILRLLHEAMNLAEQNIP